MSAEDMLKTVFIVSKATIENAKGGEFKGDTGIGVTVRHADGEKCERCWTYSETVGKDAAHPTLCSRCAAIIGK